MKLKIWSAAKAAGLTAAFQKVLQSFRPDIPPHEFISYSEISAPEVPDAAPGEIVLVCGTRPLTALQKAKLAPKGRTVTSLRETVLKAAGGGAYFVTYDPGILDSDPEKLSEIEWDLRLAVRFMRTGGLEPEVGEYRWVNSFQPVIDWVEALYAKTGKPVDVSTDTETMTFYPWYPDRDIVSISFTAEPRKSYLLYLGPQKPPVPLDPAICLFDQIQWLLTSPKVKLRLANGKYDLIWIAEKWGIECTNFKFDTMLVGSLLNENRSNSLSMHAKTMTPIGGYDLYLDSHFDKGHMEKIPTGPLLTYAGGDTDATHMVADQLRDELMQDAPLANFYVKILHPAARAFEKIERRGVLVDVNKYHQLADELRGIIGQNQKLALDLLPNRLRIKYRDKIEGQIAKGKSPLLPSLLKEFFFSPAGLNLTPNETTEKTGEPSMTKSHLRQFADVPEAKAMVTVLTDLDNAAKTLSTFVEGFLKHLRPDGRFHSTYFLAKGEFDGFDDDDVGTVTGRLSAKDPAIQTLPKKTKWAKRLRECFVAPPGKKVVSVDYSQGELRVVACVANEKTMIEAYQKGLDLHAVTGAKLGGVPVEEFLTWKDSTDTAVAELFEKYRGNAKPANFGLLYGMSAEGFQAYAWTAYGLKLTLEEATTIRNAFFELYPGLIAYHDNQKAFVQQWEMVRTPLGRIRHLPTIRSRDRSVQSKARRQAINSPIQGCLSDMMLWAIARIEQEFTHDEFQIVAMIHDAFIAYVDEDKVVERCKEAKAIMENLPFHEVGWSPILKFPADAEYGDDLAHMQKLKLAA
jgi:DNA polymerase I-like protein with 3'-5' exonuclease and polymerase domains